VSAAATPVARDVLAGHLGMVRLPARTNALLERAGEGPGTLESRTTTGWGTIEARAIDLVAERLTRLLDGIYDPSEQADLASLTRVLSGLGPGLTPTGDDLLVGIAAACQRLAAGGYWPEARHASLVAALAEIGDTGTTAIAREMVDRAAAGRFPDELTSFVELLGDRDADADQAQAAVERLAAIGAHSGADMLAGVVALAARACREGKPR
jgi:hypothetical protein